MEFLVNGLAMMTVLSFAILLAVFLEDTTGSGLP